MEGPQHSTTRSTWLWGSLLLALIMSLQVVQVKSNAERDALISLKNSLVDPNQALKTWDPTRDTPCTFFHVTCNREERVIRIDLFDDGFSGKLPTGLGALDQLLSLTIRGNNIEGPIPADIGNLKNLDTLDLSSNSLSGSIPPSFGNLQSLEVLKLRNNQLSGQVPKEVGDIPKLRYMNIANNNFCGFLPIQLLRVPQLYFYDNPGVGKPCP